MVSKTMRPLRLLFGVVLLLCASRAIACWEEAGARYGVHPQLLYAIAKTESSLDPKAVNGNKNGSRDVGLMQINSFWFPILKKHGIEEEQLFDPCTSIHVGAWILAQNLQRMGNTWKAVGAYNSSKPDIRLRYAQKVYKHIPAELLKEQAGQ